MDNSTVDSMCRCCAAEGIFKDIKTSYHWMGEEEVYGDMLRECFDVKLAMIEEGGICEVCITQLRNAVNFKKQVLHTEKKFKRHMESRRFKPTEVKEEVSGDNGNSSDDNDNGGADSEDDEDYVPDFEIPIKTESPEEAKSRKRSAKATTSRAKKSRTDDADKSNHEPEKTPPSETTSADPISEMSPRQTKIRGIKQVLLWSTATPVWRHSEFGYKCSYCELKYPQLDRLKKHTLEEHDDVTEARFLRNTFFQDVVIRLDITEMRCKLCCGSFDTLNTIIEHLNLSHKKRIDVSTASVFHPLKFQSETLHCGLCSDTFVTYKSLERHLNVHMTSYKCNVCDDFFVSKNMREHHYINYHKKSSVPIKTNQMKCNTPRVCQECGERFPNRYRKLVHIKKVHREPENYHSCNACDKICSTKEKLSIHLRRDHLMERPFQCKECPKAFFKLHFLMKHMITHSDEKKYSCNICRKTFKFYTSLGPHMEIHSGVRRFKCKLCEQTFVQKASWKGHMRARHGVNE